MKEQIVYHSDVFIAIFAIIFVLLAILVSSRGGEKE